MARAFDNQWSPNGVTGPARSRGSTSGRLDVGRLVRAAGLSLALALAWLAASPRPALAQSTPDPLIVAKAGALGNDPAQIFAFVRDEIAFEVYPGALRGARGALLGAAANSIDRSILLAELLHAAGHPQTRFARGVLDTARRQELIRSMFGEDALRVRGCIPPGTPTSVPEFDGTLFNDLQDHLWLEVDLGGGFVAADASFRTAALGDTFTTPSSTSTEVPASLFHTVRFRLDVESYSQAAAAFASGGLGQASVLDRTYRAADLAGRPVSLGFFVDVTGAGSPVFSYRTNTYTPYLLRGQMDAESADDPIDVGSPFQEAYTNFPLGNQVLTGVFLHVDLAAPGASPLSYDRTIYDRIGFAARHGGLPVNVGVLDQEPVLTDFDVTTVNVLGGRQGLGGFVGQRDRVAAAAQALAAIAPQVQAIPADGSYTLQETELLRQASSLTRTNAMVQAELATMAFQATADRAVERLSAMSLVHAYAVSPRLTLALSRKVGDGAVLELDVLKNDLRIALPRDQSVRRPFGFEVMRGIVESSLEGAVLAQVTGQPAASIAEVLQGASAAGDLATITPLDAHLVESLAISDEAKARIQSALAMGKMVIAPTHPVVVGGDPITGWLETDSTGHTISAFENGGHQAIVNYTGALEFSAEYNKPFANFIGRVTAYGQVGFLYASAVVTAISTGGNLDGTVADTKNLIKQLVEQSEALNKTLEDMKKKFEKYKQDTTGFGFVGDMMEGFLKGLDEAKRLFTYFTPADPSAFEFLVAATGPDAPADPPGATPGVEVSVLPDPDFTQSSDGAELASVYVMRVKNTGPATDSFQISGPQIPAGFDARVSRTRVTVPAGATGEISVCLVPSGLVPAVGAPANLALAATSTSNGAISDQEQSAFTTPATPGVVLTAAPTPVTTAAGTGVEVTLGIRASGNQPVDVDLTLDLPPGLTATGLLSPVSLLAGETRTQTLTLTPAPGTAPGTQLVALVGGEFGAPGARRTVQTALALQVVSPEASCASPAADTARAIGRTGLADVLTGIGRAMSLLAAAPLDSSARAELLALLGNAAVQVNVGFLSGAASGISAARAQLLAATDVASVNAALAVLSGALCNLQVALESAGGSELELTIAPTSAVIAPSGGVTFNVFLRNAAPRTRALALELGSLPAGITGGLNTSSVTLIANQTTTTFGAPQVQVTLTHVSGELQPFDFTVTAREVTAPSKERSATAALTVRPELVSVVDVQPVPAHAAAGEHVAVTARLFNAVNAPRSVQVYLGVKTPSGSWAVFPSLAASATLGVLEPLVDVPTGFDVPAAAVDGIYQIEISLADAANGQAIAGATATAPLLVGAPLGARLTVAPALVPPGTTTVQGELTIDRESVPNPTATLVGALATPAIARDVVVNGNLLYVCENDRILVVDVTDPTQPVLAATFAQSDLAADFEGVGCRISGSNLIVVHSQGVNPPATELTVFDISTPMAPSPVSHVSLAPRAGSRLSFVSGGHGFIPITQYLYNPFSNFIFQQFGDLLSVDLTVPASPSLAGRLFPAGDPIYGGPNMIFSADLAAGQVGLVASTTATGDGFGTGPGSGRLLSVDVSSPTAPSLVGTTIVPEARLLHNVAVDGPAALVLGDTLGFSDAISGFTGHLTISTADVSNPSAPQVQSTLVTQLSDRDGAPVVSMGGGVFAVAGGKIGNRSELILVDASNPAAPRYVPYDVPVPIRALARSGNFFYAVGDDGLTVFELGSVTGPVLTARVEIPRSAGVDVVPGSFSPAPTAVEPGAASDTYVFEQPLVDSITWSQTIAGMQPGEVRQAVAGGRLDFVLPTFGSGQLDLAPVDVAAVQVVGIAPPSLAANVGDAANYVVTLVNPTASDVDYALDVSGVDPGWVTLDPVVHVVAGGTATVPLVLRSDLAARPFLTHTFSVTATGSNGATGIVFASLSVGSPASLGSNESRRSPGMTVELLPPELTIGPGGVGVTTARLRNVGNAMDSLSAFGFGSGLNVVSVPSSATPLAPGETYEVDLVVSVSPFQAPGDVAATIRGIGTFVPGPVDAVLTVHVPGQGVGMFLTPGTGSPATTFQAVVQNRGSAPDTFDLVPTGVLAPAVLLGAPSISLDPGQSTQVPLTLGPTGPFLSGAATLVLKAVSRANPQAFAIAGALVTLDQNRQVAALFEPSLVEIPGPGAVSSTLRIANGGNLEDDYVVSITGVVGPVTAALRAPGGGAVQSVPSIRLAAFGDASLALDATLTAPGEGTVDVDIVSSVDGAVTAHAALVVRSLTATPTPTPSATPTVAATPTATQVEDCFNCRDDDGDALVDRRDPDCAPRADGGGVGLGDARRGKALRKCQSALRVAAERHRGSVHKRLQKCADAVLSCVQTKPGDAACLTRARSVCAAQVSGLDQGPRSDAAKLRGKIEKSCGVKREGEPAQVPFGDLLSPTGLGFAAQADACAGVGVPSLASLDDVSGCVDRMNRCRAAEALGIDAPRLGELLRAGGVESALSCPAGPVDGGGVGVGDDRRGKAAAKCAKSLETAATAFTRGLTRAWQKCGDAVLRCLQEAPGDARCLGKAQASCAKLAAKLDGGAKSEETKLRERVAKACGPRQAGDPPQVPLADLLAPAGLGFQGVAAACPGTPLSSLDAIASCALESNLCRAEQMRDGHMPRAAELLGIGGLGIP